MKAKRFLALLLSVMMVLGMMPMTVFAYFEEPSAEGNNALETTVYDYTKPVGVTMQRLTGNCVAEFGEDGNLGDDLLFVIKSGDRYYAMKDVAASETAYSSIPAVDVTDWVNADGSLTVPADTLGVAFWRYEERFDQELGMFINGRNDYLTYSSSYESVDGDDDHYNDAERIYSGSFKIRTFEIGQYIFNPGYWSENEVSGTLNFGGRWSYYISSYNSINLKYELITDLRDDGIGGKEFYFRYLGTNVEYVGDEVEGYLYYADCRHQGTICHAEYDAPTCMLKGCEEYWYCENCNRYAKDENFTEFFGEEMPVIPATGHDFDNEKCKNCDRPVPVYSKVTNQAQFDALADDTMFILVAEYNGKHYAMDFSEVYSYMIDSDGDGFYDIHDVDDNSDGIPDYLEFDEGGEEGVYDYLEWDMDDDGDVDDYDLHEFHIMVCDQHLTDMLYSNGGINATEITINSDGTISHEEAKKTAEFEMVDVYLAEDYNPDWHNYWENGEMPYHTKCIKQFVIPNYFLSAPSMRPIERMYQQRIYDFGDSSSWGVIFYDSRDEYYSYVDGDMDEKVDADEDGKPDPLPFPDVNKEGSVAVFDTFDDIMWILYDEGQMAQLRLRDYNGTIGFVTGHDYELEGWEWVDDDTYEDGGYYNTHDTQACVYLYASAQYDSHTCDFGDWVDDENGRTHTRTCKDSECGKKETKTHGWDDGVQVGTPTCTEGAKIVYTCGDCGATYEEEVDNLGHDWGEWTDDGESSSTDTHSRTCKRNCGVAAEIENHNWSRWTPVDDNTHKKTCSTCTATRTATHNWAEGVVAKEPTEFEEGLMTYTCGDCAHTKGEPIPKLNHNLTFVPVKDPTCTEDGNVAHYYCGGCQRYYSDEAGTTEIAAADVIRERLGHDWSEWIYDSVDSHIRNCKRNCGVEEEFDAHNWGEWTVYDDNTHRLTCSICHGYQEEEHDWDNGVETVSPTCYSTGVMTYTCGTCGHTKTEEIPMTEHTWTDWAPNGDENHKRECLDDNCDKFETEDHEWDDGVVTTEPSCTEKGVKTYTCQTCQHTKTEDLPKTDHQWTDWSPNGDGTHTRACRCNANEIKDCTYDDGVVTEEPTHVEPGTKLFTCTVCGHTYEEDVPVLTEHEWGEWVINKLDEANTHIRFCICDESQTAPHNFDEGVVTTEATHTSKGVKTFTCGDCGYSYTEDIPETPEHEWTNWSPNGDGTHTRACRCNANETKDCTYDDGVVTEQPSHVEPGTTLYTCTACGHTYEEEIPVLPDHEWGEWVINKLDEANTHIRYCICNESQTAPHNFDAGVVTTEPTHTSKGVKTYTCTDDCGYSYTEEIPETTEHQWTDWSDNGNGTHTRACRCNANETKDCEWDGGVITKQPTHYEEGVKTFTCTICDGQKTEPIAKTTAHEWGDWAKKDDNSHIRECKCGEIETKDHTFDAGTVTKEPTHLETGIKKFTCTDCGFVREDVLNKTLDHTFGEWMPLATVSGKHYRECACGEQENADCAWDNGKITTNATHYEEGVKTFACTACANTKTEAIAKTTAHEWGDWEKKDDKSHIRECKCGEIETKDHTFDAGTVTKEPTHLETGVKKFTCTDCGFVREDTLDKTPEHSFGEWKTEATVVGKHYRECACGEREIGDCTWDAGVVTTEPTYEATGTKTYTCTVCGGTKNESLDMLIKTDEIISPDNSEIKITAPEGSNAVLNENTVLKVEKVKDEVSDDVKANVEIVVGNDNAEVLASYDISLLLDGATVQPGGAVEVTLPAPENAGDFDTLQVVYIDDDGNVTPCETRVNADGTVTFVTDHFSHYAIVGVQNSSPVVWILISAISVALIAGAVVAVLVIKKKKGIA